MTARHQVRDLERADRAAQAHNLGARIWADQPKQKNTDTIGLVLAVLAVAGAVVFFVQWRSGVDTQRLITIAAASIVALLIAMIVLVVDGLASYHKILVYEQGFVSMYRGGMQVYPWREITLTRQTKPQPTTADRPTYEIRRSDGHTAMFSSTVTKKIASLGEAITAGVRRT